MYHANGKLHTVHTPKGHLCVSIHVHQTNHFIFWILSFHDNEWKSTQHLREVLHFVRLLNLTFK